MKNDKWRDISSHSQDETLDERQTPNAVEFVGKHIRVRVHRHMNYKPDEWLVTCYVDSIDGVLLINRKLKEAKMEGLGHARGRLLAMLAEIEEAMKS